MPSVLIAIDNTASSINGDFTPTRLAFQVRLVTSAADVFTSVNQNFRCSVCVRRDKKLIPTISYTNNFNEIFTGISAVEPYYVNEELEPDFEGFGQITDFAELYKNIGIKKLTNSEENKGILFVCSKLSCNSKPLKNEIWGGKATDKKILIICFGDSELIKHNKSVLQLLFGDLAQPVANEITFKVLFYESESESQVKKEIFDFLEIKGKHEISGFSMLGEGFEEISPERDPDLYKAIQNSLREM